VSGKIKSSTPSNPPLSVAMDCSFLQPSSQLCLKPERQHDPYYRYKMPPIECSCDNRSKQRKTHLHNIGVVARAIFRPEAWLVKYLALRLSTDSGKSATSGDEAYLTGHHSPAALQAMVFEFIVEYVLCKCGSPETLLHVEGKKRQKVCMLQCHSCGRNGKAAGQSEKMLNLFAAHPMPPALCPMMTPGGKVILHGERAEDVVKAFCAPTRDAASSSELGGDQGAAPPAGSGANPPARSKRSTETDVASAAELLIVAEGEAPPAGPAELPRAAAREQLLAEPPPPVELPPDMSR